MARNVIEVVVQGIDRASDPLGKVSKFAGSMAKAIAVVGTAAIAAGGALFTLTTKVAAMENRVAKAAKQLGVATSELSKWQKVAEYADIGNEEFTNGVRFLQRATSEAAQGVGEYADQFRMLGINAREFQKLSLTDQMRTLNTAFGGVTDQADKMNIAMSLMSRSGGKMLQLFDGNNEALDQLAQRAERLGGVLRDDAAANAELFMDRLGEVQTAIGAVSRAAVDDLVPVFSGLLGRLAEKVADLAPVIRQFVKDAVADFITFGIVVGQTYDGVKKLFAGVAQAAQSNETTGGFLAIFKEMYQRVIVSTQVVTNAIAAMWKISWNSFLVFGKYAVVNAFTFLVNDLKIIYNAMVATFQGAWEFFVTLGSWAWRSVKALMKLGPETETFAQALADGMVAAAAVAQDNVQAIKDSLKAEGDAPTFVDAMRQAIAEAAQIGKEQLVTMADDVMTNNNNLLSGLADFLASTLNIDVEAARQQAQAMLSGLAEFNTETTNVVTEGASRQRGVLEELDLLWQDFFNKQGTAAHQLAQSMFDTMQGAVSAIGDGFGAVIAQGANAAETFKNILRQVAAASISALVQIGIQRLVLQKIFAASNANLASSEGQMRASLGAANMYATMAGAPFPVNLTAPAWAAKTYAAISALGLQATAAAVAGMAHGGMDYVPKEATYLLDRGERVLSPRQNQDLTNFMDSGGGQAVTIQQLTVSVLPNATNADFLARMSERDIEDLIARPVLKAIDSLTRRGQGYELAARGARV